LTEEQLKQRIRDERKDLKTGSADPENGKAALQRSQMLEQIKKTNGHAKRNILTLRENVVNDLLPQQGKGIGAKGSKSEGDDPSTSARLTKAQLLEQQSHSIVKISENVDQATKFKQRLFEAKAAKQEVENLKEALRLGLLSQDDFDERARTLLLGKK